jgi:DNA-binding MarR family transcriptional regulator
MLQPTSVEETASLAPTTTPQRPSDVPMADALDARIDELHQALRLVITNARRQRHHDELDKAAIALLYVLSEREPVRAAGLVVCTGLDASTISRHIKALIDSGYITQSPDPDDARARLLSLSSSGHELLRRVRSSKVAQSRAALADWTPSDIDTLTALLRRLGAALEPEDS